MNELKRDGETSCRDRWVRNGERETGEVAAEMERETSERDECFQFYVIKV